MGMQTMGTRKGQLSFVNLIGILFDLLIYFIVILPIYQPYANTAILGLDPNWTTYGVTVVLIQMFPLVMIIALTLQLLSYAQPHYQ